MAFGIFNDEGIIEGDFHTRAEAEAAVRTRYAEEDPDDIQIRECCHDHPDEPAEACEECDEQDDDEDEIHDYPDEDEDEDD